MENKEIITYVYVGHKPFRTNMDINNLEKSGFVIYTFKGRNKIINHAIMSLSGNPIITQQEIDEFKFPFENEEWFLKMKKTKITNV
jgi:hypothetical protein